MTRFLQQIPMTPFFAGAAPHQTASGVTGQGPYCESPSSGFGSEASKYSNTDLHADNAGEQNIFRFKTFSSCILVCFPSLTGNTSLLEAPHAAYEYSHHFLLSLNVGLLFCEYVALANIFKHNPWRELNINKQTKTHERYHFRLYQNISPCHEYR